MARWGLLQGGGGPVEDADPRLAARAFTLLFAGGMAVAWLWIALADIHGPRMVALEVLAGLGTVTAGAVLLLAQRFPRSARPFVLGTVIVFVSVAVVLTGGLHSPFALFYAWAAAWAVAFLPRRVATFELGLIIVGYAVAMVIHGDGGQITGEQFAVWMFRVATVVAVVAVVAGLAAAVDRQERARRRRERQQQAVARLGVSALIDGDVDQLIDRAVGELADQLDVGFAAYLDRDRGRQGLLPRALRGWDLRVLGTGREIPLEDAPQAAQVLARDEPVISPDLQAETRFPTGETVHRHNVRGSLGVPVRGPEGTYGVLVAHSVEPNAFDQEDLDFALGVASVLGAAIERHGLEDAIRHQSLHDPLTGAANRTLFFDRIQLATARAHRTGSRLAVLYLDLDGFKAINDSLGHQAGDALLRALAPRLREAVRGTDTVARLGGDEFAVLCEDISGLGEAREVAARVLAAVHQPVEHGGARLQVSASIGVSLSENGEPDPQGLVRDADAALYRAKSAGRGRFEVWNEALRSGAEARRRIEAALRSGLDNDELYVAYEPIVELSTETAVGAEALVRWRHPAGATIPPREFVEVAEAAGLMPALTATVLRDACRAAAAWPDEAWVSVNVSPRQLSDPELATTVEAALQRSGLEPHRLHLELTETAVLGDAYGLVAPLERLKALGIRIVLDDFGTGFASLAHLRRHPIDAIKVDRAFVAPLPGGSTERAIVRAMVGLAASLGLELIAEGVERPRQAEALRALGCELAQGFAYGRECTAEEIAERMRIIPGLHLRAARER